MKLVHLMKALILQINVMSDLKIPYKKNWPSEVDIRYGEKSVANLCEQFHISERKKNDSCFS